MSEAILNPLPFFGPMTEPLEAIRLNLEDQLQVSYQESHVFTASREELVLMLYDGAAKFIQRGLQALEDRDTPGSQYNLLRAQKIVHYLNMSLDVDQGQEIARNLARLYDFVNYRLSLSHRDLDPQAAEEALRVVNLLRQAWSQTFSSQGGDA